MLYRQHLNKLQAEQKFWKIRLIFKMAFQKDSEYIFFSKIHTVLHLMISSCAIPTQRMV